MASAPSLFLSSPPSSVPSMYTNYFLDTNLPTIEVATPDPITFFAIGDVPYYAEQTENLTIQMQNIPPTADFVIHVGDMRNASIKYRCDPYEYEEVANILRLSPIPVFIILGDNDWEDCSNSAAAYQYWKDEFLNFESRYWDHDFTIVHQTEVEENFAFVHKGSLFMGLNMVGRYTMGSEAWSERMTSQVNWVIESIREYRDATIPGKGRVFLFGHAKPRDKHNAFFEPLRDFIRDELENSIPILYLHGDDHEWLYAPDFLNQESFLRIMVAGEAAEPPLKFVINSNDYLFPTTKQAFPYFRDLDNSTLWNTLSFVSNE